MEWIELGYLGLFIVSFLAATILPLSSDVVLATMLTQPFNPFYLLVISTFGNWLGGITSYIIGYNCNWIWIERRLKISEKTLEKSNKWVNRYGTPLALFSWIPLIGDPLIVSLGVLKSNPVITFCYMLIGKFARYWVIVYTFENLID